LRPAPALGAAGAVAALLLPLAGCTTTQERSAELAKSAEKAAKAKQFSVGKTNRAIRAASVTTLKGPDANAVVVKVVNRSGRPQVVVPIGVDLYDAKGTSFFTNRVDGLDAPLNNLPLAPAGTSWWVNNQLPTTTAARTRVRIGTSRTAVPAKLPEIKVSAVQLADDDGVKVARGKVENLSSVEQLRLTIFGVATKDGKVVAAGRSVIEKLGPKGTKRQRFNIYFNGDPTGAKLEISAPPSTLKGA
jgi:hypothetical protein